jgi:manganese/zinc/iron transport system substrate-binding protein
MFFIMIYKEKRSHNNVLNVVCTTSIIGDIVKQVSGDNITIHTLMGPGVDPHLYKPLENDIMNIAQADVIFYNGLHLEAQMEHIFQHLQEYKTTIPITKDIPQENLIASFEYDNHYDPHVWFHLPLWMNTIHTIAETLCDEDPEHAEEYKKNAANYHKECETVFERTSKLLQKIPKEKRILITGHDAFQYFAQAYDFEVVGLQGISTESQVGSQDIQQLIDFIVLRKIPALFIETSTPIRNIKTIQEGVAQKYFSVEIGGELYSDALGSKGTPENSYLGMIESNIYTIYHALMK